MQSDFKRINKNVFRQRQLLLLLFSGVLYWVPLDNFYDSVMWDNLRTVIHLRKHSDNNQRIKNKQNIKRKEILKFFSDTCNYKVLQQQQITLKSKFCRK